LRLCTVIALVRLHEIVRGYWLTAWSKSCEVGALSYGTEVSFFANTFHSKYADGLKTQSTDGILTHGDSSVHCATNLLRQAQKSCSVSE